MKKLKILTTIGAFISILILGIPTTQAATFSSIPNIAEFPQECQISYDIIADTFGIPSNAADIEVNFDPTEVTIIDSDTSQPGTQIETGEAYEVYVVNEVDNASGTIKVAAASFSQYLTSEKRFATINFRSNPGITSTTFRITFDGAGETLDSNIARASDSNDLLTAVSRAEFTFVPGSCTTDVSGPTIQTITPKENETSINPNTNVELNLLDDYSGVDIDTVRIIINNVEYSIQNGNLNFTGSPDKYLITLDLENPLPQASPIVVIVFASDNVGNDSQTSYTFFTWADATQPNQAICEVNRAATCGGGENNISVLDNVNNLGSDSFPKTLNDVIEKTSLPGIAAIALMSYLTLAAGFLFNAFGINAVLNSIVGALNSSKYNLYGTIFNSNKRARAHNAIITIKNSSGKPIAQTLTDKNGKYKFSLSKGEYSIQARYNKVSKVVSEKLAVEPDQITIANLSDNFGESNTIEVIANALASSFRITLLLGLILSILAIAIIGNIFTFSIAGIYISLLSIPVLKK